MSLEDIPDMAVTGGSEQADDTVDGILSLLPKGSAELLLLTMKGYKYSEIAERLDIPVGTVKSRLHNARSQFRSVCTPEQIMMFEKGRITMSKKDQTCGFPEIMPELVL